MKSKTLPRKLYKYKPFNVYLLNMLTNAEAFYANPADFNDPLDCKPELHIDVSQQDLENLWRHLMQQDGARNIERVLQEHRYMATEYGRYDDGADGSQCYIRDLKNEIHSNLFRYFGSRGVFSLAAKWDCPLMWSHYADEHRGVCIEYSTENHKCSELGAVDYNSSRYIAASDLIEWKIKGSASAGRKIFDQYFYSKASSWKYEKEWRSIHESSGSNFMPFSVSAIHFGFRCEDSVEISLIRLLHDKNIKFFSVYSKVDGFKLVRREIDTGEAIACGVRESPLFIFDGLLKETK